MAAEKSPNGTFWKVYAAAGLIILAAAVVYSSSLKNDFVYDDASSIGENPTIRSLWPI